MKNLEFLSILREHGAFLEGHFELPGGMHSDVYIQTRAALKHPHLALTLASAMSNKFVDSSDVVLAPSLNTSEIAQGVAKARNARAVYAERDENGNIKLAKGFTLKEGETVLIVDDVAVSGKQIMKACNLAKSFGAKVIGVSVMVDRSVGYLPLNIPLRALVSYPLKTHNPKECPMCKNKTPLNKPEEIK